MRDAIKILQPIEGRRESNLEEAMEGMLTSIGKTRMRRCPCKAGTVKIVPFYCASSSESRITNG